MLVPIAVFLVSVATLALELVLVRALSIGHWHHFSYLVISTALLGFGAGGAFVAIAWRRLNASQLTCLWACALAMGVSIPVVFSLCQQIPLDELQLIWDRRQILYLFGYYLLFAVPFCAAGVFTAMVFAANADRAERFYFFNMAGSGLGAAAAVAFMYGNSPESLLLVVSTIAFAAAGIIASMTSVRLVAATVFFAAVCVLLFNASGPLALKIKISENKSLVYYEALPSARRVTVRYSPLARLDCIEAPVIRYFPGLALGYEGALPRQMVIISDADAVSAVNHFEHLGDLYCFDRTTSALACHLVARPNVCVIGAGGGSDVAQALFCGASKVVAVEMNPQTVELVRDKFGEFASGLYNRADVNVVVAEGRSFLQNTKEKFDVITISLLDSFSASAAGVYALNESHLYTVEAVRKAFSKLGPGGLLSITRGLKTPPRDELKMLATIAEALRRHNVPDISRHIMMIRSWAAITIVASPLPFSPSQVAAAREFARQRRFDLVHLPGIRPEDANRFYVLEQPAYYESAQQILSSGYKRFYRNYAYNIRPATDDRPYFFDFFKWKSLPFMIRTLRGRWLLFSEWAYLVLAATFLQAAAASAIMIVLPLLLSGMLRRMRSGKLAVLVYFGLLGFAYMFLEMGFIQKMTLLIGHPVFGVAVTLTGFLVFSGCGSLAWQRLFTGSSASRIRKALLAVVIAGAAEILILRVGFEWLVGLPWSLRTLLGVAVIAPVAFFMGMPFPAALKLLGSGSSGHAIQPNSSRSDVGGSALVAWAWGINGFTSVTGAVLGTLLAISLGFATLAVIALGCYLVARIAVGRCFYTYSPLENNQYSI
jgi:spermidine synthase